jgi:hypothetical protein
MSDWPAMSGSRRWGRKRLLQVAGPRTVPVELGRSQCSKSNVVCPESHHFEDDKPKCMEYEPF